MVTTLWIACHPFVGFNTMHLQSVQSLLVFAQGSSILVTSVTDMMVFLVGTYTDLPVLKAFSIYAFLGVMFDFIYQVTFFAAFVALDARREKRAMHGGGFLGLSCCGNGADTESVPTPKVRCSLGIVGTSYESAIFSL